MRKHGVLSSRALNSCIVLTALVVPLVAAAGGAGERPASFAGRILPGHLHPEVVAEAAHSWWQGEYATGGWGGVRERWEEAGGDLQAAYLLDSSQVVGGGAHRGRAGRGLFDLNLTLDLDKLLSLPSTTLFLDLHHFRGRNGSDDVGDLQGISNIDADPVTDLAEAWVETVLADDRLRLKIGKVDANAEFAYVGAGGELIHASAGVSPTLVGLPTYPDPAWSVNLFAYPTETTYAGVALYDGSSLAGEATGTHAPRWGFDTDRFWIGEAGVVREGVRIGVGLWHHTGEVARFDTITTSGTTGGYLVAEARVWRPAGGKAERGLSCFLQVGWADEAVSEVGRHLGVGVRWGGPWAGRPEDVAAAMVSFADLSDAEGAPFAGDETAVELTYRLQLTPFLSLQPDLQWIHNPSGDSNLNDATVAGVRLSVAL